MSAGSVLLRRLLGTRPRRPAFGLAVAGCRPVSDGRGGKDEGERHAALDAAAGSVDPETHRELLARYELAPADGLRVLLVQPFYRLGEHARLNTDRDLMLQESMALVETLGWRAADAAFLGLDEGATDGRAFFGFGQAEALKERLARLDALGSAAPTDPSDDVGESSATLDRRRVGAVFVSTDRLTSRQRASLEEIVQRPVVDRYSVVLQIFKRHARSPEAKAQVQLAEIPYLRSRLSGDYEMELLSKHDPSKRKGEAYFNACKRHLSQREKVLKEKVEKVARQRELLRKNRRQLQFPTVAVVGYTNAGKTSLIKALTGGPKLTPLNRLFATLDVTVHPGRLTHSLNALFVDTVGFISDIPMDLIACFRSTLEDAVLADAVVHVRDPSHPDHVAQNSNVLETLERLGINIDTLITVGNKIDRLEPADWPSIKKDGMIPISCTHGYGIAYLKQKVEEELIKVTGRKSIRIRIPTAGDELSWLYKNATVSEVTADMADDNFCLANVILTDLQFKRFRKTFLGKDALRETDEPMLF